MSRRVCMFFVFVAMVAGFVGGAVAHRLFTPEPVCAQQKTDAGRVIEAQEFRLLDKNGKAVARLTVQGGNILAEVPDFSGWTIKFPKRASGQQ